MFSLTFEGGPLPAITILTLVIVAPIALLTGFFALELFLGLPRGRDGPAAPSDASAVIVVPAHDEAKLIAATVARLLKVAEGRCRLLVVADNCTDETAEEARSTGAEVLVRDDPANRGKGHALAAARDHLRGDPPDAVVVIDADSRIDSGSLRRVISVALKANRPAQAVYLFTPDRKAPPLVQISNFALMIKNLVRLRGLQRLAGRAHLTGTGMAFPWPLFEQSSLGGSNIVEDLVVGLELAEQGHAPLLADGATVWSEPAAKDETLVQRSRWEGGYLATALRIAPALFARSVRRGDLAGIAAAVDLAIPPLALLVMLNALALSAAILACAIGGAMWPAFILVVTGALAFLALGLAWIREGRPFASGATLLRLPLYVLWKLPMYLRFARRGAPKEWVRTAR